MTSKERLIKILNGEIPDCVPASPDTSNMIPARMAGKPFWDIYLYQDPPIWKAYIDCVKYFNFDALMDAHVDFKFDDLGDIDNEHHEVIVFRNEERIVTQGYRENNQQKIWDETVKVYYRDNPPSPRVNPSSIGLPIIPDRYEPIEGKKQWPTGEALLKLIKEEMGNHGLVGARCGQTNFFESEKDIYDFYDNPEKYYRRSEELLDYYVRRFNKLMSLGTKPDFICLGSSGTLVYQTLDTFRELALPIVKKLTSLCKKYNIPSHIHSCGPEKELVKIFAEETELTVVDPLEIPPMGDCDLKKLKKLYGNKLVLKGNLHTTEVMLNGTTKDVMEASKKAIDDAASGGRFILSTGDQCGRDTPNENIIAMIEAARTYGRY